MKDIYFPDKGLNDLFTSMAPCSALDLGRLKPATTISVVNGDSPVPPAQLSRGLTLKRYEAGYRFFEVEPAPWLVEWIGKNMLPVNNDTICFGATERKDGSVLVTARYNLILGSRWLTELRNTDDFPKEET